MSTLVWVVSLLVLGLGVMVLEVFVPSGGILGFVSILALVASVATAFL
jgi:membrane-bound ClpP family serine protease